MLDVPVWKGNSKGNGTSVNGFWIPYIWSSLGRHLFGSTQKWIYEFAKQFSVVKWKQLVVCWEVLRGIYKHIELNFASDCVWKPVCMQSLVFYGWKRRKLQMIPFGYPCSNVANHVFTLGFEVVPNSPAAFKGGKAPPWDLRSWHKRPKQMGSDSSSCIDWFNNIAVGFWFWGIVL